MQGGKKGFYPTKHLKQWVYRFRNGTRELRKVMFADGCAIELGRNYRGLSIDFLVNGGDDFKDVIGKVYSLRKEVWLGDFRDALKPQLIQMGLVTQ